MPVAISGLGTIGVFGVTPRFALNLGANHTHLAAYTRTVSLLRVSSRSLDYLVAIQSRILSKRPIRWPRLGGGEGLPDGFTESACHSGDKTVLEPTDRCQYKKTGVDKLALRNLYACHGQIYTASPHTNSTDTRHGTKDRYIQ